MKMKRTQNTQQHVVPVPLWLQRRMINNLEQAAKNIVSPSRAKRAKAVLRTISKEGKPVQQHALCNKACRRRVVG